MIHGAVESNGSFFFTGKQKPPCYVRGSKKAFKEGSQNNRGAVMLSIWVSICILSHIFKISTFCHEFVTSMSLACH